jgi:hypothetical protein
MYACVRVVVSLLGQRDALETEIECVRLRGDLENAARLETLRLVTRGWHSTRHLQVTVDKMSLVASNLVIHSGLRHEVEAAS